MRVVEFHDLEERHFVEVAALRKGRGCKPCTIMAGVSLAEKGTVIVRTLDESGVSPIVLRLTVEQAEELTYGLMKAIEGAQL